MVAPPVMTAANSDVERRTRCVVIVTPSRVACSRPAMEAPVSSSTPAISRKRNSRWAPAVWNSVREVQNSASPTSPPWRRSSSAWVMKSSLGRSGPIPKEPAARPRVRAQKRQIPPERNGRTVGSIGLSTIRAPAANSAIGTRYPTPPNR